jgi:hypothetical protein
MGSQCSKILDVRMKQNLDQSRYKDTGPLEPVPLHAFQKLGTSLGTAACWPISFGALTSIAKAQLQPCSIPMRWLR